MLLLPLRQPRQRLLLILAATDLDQRILLRSRSRLGRLHARWLTRLLAIVWRPGRIALPFLFLARRQLQQAVERSGARVHLRMTVADLREPFRHRPECE